MIASNLQYYDFKMYSKREAISYVCKFVMTLSILVLSVSNVIGQGDEINFGEFSSKYSITISELIEGDLSFGEVVQGEQRSIGILDSKVMVIEGIKYLDVIIDVDADNYLSINSALCSEPTDECLAFTLNAAYANRGNNDPSEAVIMQVNSNFASAQFPILARQNAPPGPPPTPDYEGYNPTVNNEEAYLYIYGSLTVGANAVSGVYSGDITITVIYD